MDAFGKIESSFAVLSPNLPFNQCADIQQLQFNRQKPEDSYEAIRDCTVPSIYREKIFIQLPWNYFNKTLPLLKLSNVM
jgi:hypothetical protein